LEKEESVIIKGMMTKIGFGERGTGHHQGYQDKAAGSTPG